MAHARGRIRPATGVEPSRRCNPVNGPVAAGRSLPAAVCAAALRPRRQTGDFSPRRWRLHLFRQNDAIDPAAHELIAFACRRFEPRPVNLDRTAGIGPDCAEIAKPGNDLRHRRPPHAEKFRKRLLGQRQNLSVSPIMHVQQPPRQTRLDRVQRIAGRDVLELRHQCPGVGFNRSLQGDAAFKRRLKLRRRDLQCGPCHPHHRRHRIQRRPECRQQAHGPFIADDGGRDRLSAGISMTKAIKPLRGK